MTIMAPIHTATISGHEVRFFESPKACPDLPWHSVDDLFKVCIPSRHDRRFYLRSIQRDWGKDIVTIATPTGPVTIAPHFAAQGLLGAMTEVGRIGEEVERAYVDAGIKALDVLTDRLPAWARVDFVLRAAGNGQGNKTGRPND